MRTLIMAGLFSMAGTLLAQQSPHGTLNVPCLDCHTTSSWEMSANAKFTHESTGFTLAGQHRFLECRSCHQDLVFASKAKDCLSCHTDVHDSELGNDCLSCHTTASWLVPDMRQKHQETRFPLVGRHLDAECESCHENTVPRRFASTSTECISCHQADYTATMEPSHVVAGFPVDCAECHRVTAGMWSGSFDHNLTAFPLTGAHRALICSECHTDNSFAKLPTDCFSCHDDDYAATLSPAHAPAEFSHECLTCHTTTAWSPATFDHNITGFALTGAHAGVACVDCHGTGPIGPLATDCYSCHNDDFTATVSPNHVTGGFSHDCLSCHTTTAWSPASFDHNLTAFALTGKHVTTPCSDCHVNDNYQLTFTDCYACHETEYAGVVDPNHVTPNFDHDCTPCHTTTAWLPSTFDHDGSYFRIYSGRHNGRWSSCATCHEDPANYKAFTCISCHEHSQSETDGHHDASVVDYIYNATSCYSCHGDA